MLTIIHSEGLANFYPSYPFINLVDSNCPDTFELIRIRCGHKYDQADIVQLTTAIDLTLAYQWFNHSHGYSLNLFTTGMH